MFPGVKVNVHPECSMQVVDAADGTGSTAYIVKEIANAPAGSAIAVGTEINLVNRLAAQYPDKTVFCLDPVVCPCSTMYRIHPPTWLGLGEPRSRQRGQSHHRGRRHPPAKPRWHWSACCAFTRDSSLALLVHEGSCPRSGLKGADDAKTEESNTMSNTEIVVVGAASPDCPRHWPWPAPDTT